MGSQETLKCQINVVKNDLRDVGLNNLTFKEGVGVCSPEVAEFATNLAERLAFGDGSRAYELKNITNSQDNSIRPQHKQVCPISQEQVSAGHVDQAWINQCTVPGKDQFDRPLPSFVLNRE